MGLKRFNLKVALLIPIYNEEKRISSLIESLPYPRKDIIIVDDGSIDNTSKVIENMGVVLLRHSRNYGKGYAHRTGFKYAVEHGYDYVITLDGDGQHNPQEIPKFIQKIEKTGADMIIGVRHRSVLNMPFIRYCTNLVTSFVVSFLAHKPIKDAQSGYRAISASVMKIPLTTSHFETESEIIIRAARLGYKLGSVPISTIYRGESSKIKPTIDTIRFIKLAFKSIWR